MTQIDPEFPPAKKSSIPSLAVIGEGRSGSNCLFNLLEQHSNIKALKEIFKPGNWTHSPLHPKSPFAYVKQLIDHSQGKQQVLAIHIKPWHLTLLGISVDDLFKGLKENGITHFIYLKRNDIHKQIISYANLHLRRNNQLFICKYKKLAVYLTSLLTIKPDITPAFYHLYHHYIHQQNQQIEQVYPHYNSLAITYEHDIAPDPIQCYQHILDFLKLPRQSATIQHLKRAPYPAHPRLNSAESTPLPTRPHARPKALACFCYDDTGLPVLQSFLAPYPELNPLVQINPMLSTAQKYTLADIIDHLNQIDISHFIVLERKNILKRCMFEQYKSLQASFRYRFRKNKKNEIRLNMHALCYELQHQTDQYTQLKTLLPPTKTLYLNYENDLIHSPRDAYQKLLSFLNLQDRNPSFKTVNEPKINITNHNMLQSFLNGTPYMWMYSES